jgi:hypothetical protein
MQNSKIYTLRQSTGILKKLHVLNDSTLSVIIEFMLDTFLLYESFPVQFWLAHCIYLSWPVVNGAHHVVQVMVGYFGLSMLVLLMVLFWFKLAFDHGLRLDLLCDFELACFFVHDVLFSSEYDTFVRLDTVIVEDFVCKIDRWYSWLILSKW